MAIKIALQMYTLREECQKDFVGTLEKLAELGYQGIELAGTYGLSAEELNGHLKRLNLKVVGSHTGIELLQNNLEEVIAFNKAVGNQYIICPYSRWDNKEGFMAIVETLKKAGKVIKENGLSLLYHNHAHEFEVIDGQYALDKMFDLTRDVDMAMELDTYWISHYGLDPVEYMRIQGNLIKLIHVKDMEMDGDNKLTAAVGTGIIDEKAIIEAGKALGLEWFVVEDDNPRPTPFENVKKSIDYIRSIEA